MALPVEIFAANMPADLVVYGKIFTSENNRLAEAFAVKDGSKFLTEIVPSTVKKAVYGMGWEFQPFKNNMPTRQQLDAICSDIPMYFLNDECHKALTNTILLVKAGVMGENGTPAGFLKEQAGTYVRSFPDNTIFIPLKWRRLTWRTLSTICCRKAIRCILTATQLISLTTFIIARLGSLKLAAI